MDIYRDTSIPVNIIREWCFCPRVVYYRELLNMTVNKPLWVTQGEDFHKKIEYLEKRRSFKQYGLDRATRHFNVNIKSQKLIQILEFPVLFLGAKPGNTPAMYNFMNWADFGLGTWHPKGGMFEVVRGMENLALSLGVTFKLNSPVNEIVVDGDKKAKGIRVNNQFVPADVVLSGADYHHTEKLLQPLNRQYSDEYWNKKTFAPSSLLFYVGFDKKIKNVNKVIYQM
jgi:phytoene dehydrogenase-like protein